MTQNSYKTLQEAWLLSLVEKLIDDEEFAMLYEEFTPQNLPFRHWIMKNFPSKTKTPQSVRQTSDLKRVTSHCWWMFYRCLIPSHARMVPFVIQQKDFVLYY